MANNLTFKTNLVPAIDKSYSLGSTTATWNNIYANTFNGNLNAISITATGNLTLMGNAYLNNETHADSLTVGSLLVNGNTNFVQIPTSQTPAAGDNSNKIATTAFVSGAVTGLVGPMHFIGSLGTNGSATALNAASASNEGHTYKVITAGTYQGVSVEVGDVLISDGSSWIKIPSGDEPSGTVTSIKITTSSPLSGGSSSAVTTSGSWSLSLANAYGDTKNPYGNKNANVVLAGPSSGSAAAPSFRSLVAADIPNLSWDKITSGNDDLNAIEALTGTTGLLKKTAANTWTLDTSNYLTTYTDTKNTAGSTDTASKIFLIGATSQTASSQTYSDNEVFATSGVLTAKTFNSTSLTASQAVVTDANNNLASRGIRNNTAKGALGWTNASTDITLITTNTIAYWNGAYADTSSNLTYSANGIIMGLSTAQTVTATKTFSAIQKFTNTTNSTHSKDTAAAISTSGGISVEKQLSAKSIRIDNNQTTAGVQLIFNETTNALNFVFA